MKIFVLLFSICFTLYGAAFIKSGNTVVDSVHNLLWQDHLDNTNILKSQAGAVEYCQNLSQSGFSDWRLPSVEEYKYILDKTRKDEIMINKKFHHIVQDGYWTIDKTWRTLNRYGYYIYFKSGTFYYENKTYPKYVRCVRDN
jgi:hypothetical protein